MADFCPHCGAIVRSGATFCGTCGQSTVLPPVLSARGGITPAASWSAPPPASLRTDDGRQFSLAATVTRIGRDPANEVPLIDAQASARHAEVEQSAGGYILRDLRSTNGTYLNNQRLAGDCRLTDDDIILVGSTRLTFRLGVPSSVGVSPRPGTQAMAPVDLQSLLSGTTTPQVPVASPQPAWGALSQGGQQPAQQPAQQPQPTQASRGFLDGLFGPRAVGRVPFEPKDTQEQPPADFSRTMVMLAVTMAFLTAIAGFVAAMMAAAIVLVCLGAGALLFIVPFLFMPLQMLFGNLTGWLKEQKPITVIRFRVEDELSGRPVEVVLWRKMGEGGGIYQNDRVEVWGRLRGGTLYASKARVEGSGVRIRAQNPWPIWIGLLALVGMAAQAYYLITLIQNF